MLLFSEVLHCNHTTIHVSTYNYLILLKQQEEEESDNKVTKAVLCQEGLLTLNFYGRMANIIPQFKTHSKLHKMCI